MHFTAKEPVWRTDFFQRDFFRGFPSHLELICLPSSGDERSKVGLRPAFELTLNIQLKLMKNH
jgi:hypothetical protein